MGATRRSGNTAGEALPLQLHIVGPQKGVGPFFRRRALAGGADRSGRPSFLEATPLRVLRSHSVDHERPLVRPPASINPGSLTFPRAGKQAVRPLRLRSPWPMSGRRPSSL